MIGTLSENAKAQARQARETHVRLGMPASAVGDEWVLTELPFSLHTLTRPNQHQKAVLEAIRRSALHLDPQPGAGINAVPFWLDQNDKHPRFAGGYLPLEPRPVGADAPRSPTGKPMPLAAQAAFFASRRRALPILLCPLIKSLVVSEGKTLAAENMRNLSARDRDVDPRRLTAERNGRSSAW